MTTAMTPFGAATKALALPGTANVSDEAARAGMSFGKLVEFTGKSVAETQLKLNETGAAMASTLATTMVDVIAVQESIYLDNGTLSESQTFTRKLPLINFIDPVFYEWSGVRLQGQFSASELVASNEATRNSLALSDSMGGVGISFGIIGVGAIGSSTSSSSSSSDVDQSFDRSFGHVRASALLEPRRDIGVPQPRQVVRGPSLNVIAGEIQDVIAGGVLTGRTMSALLELRRQDGTPISGKSISIETDGAPWSFATAEETTDGDGQIALILRRDFLGATPDTAPKDVVLSARLGLVSNSTTLTF